MVSSGMGSRITEMSSSSKRLQRGKDENSGSDESVGGCGGSGGGGGGLVTVSVGGGSGLVTVLVGAGPDNTAGIFFISAPGKLGSIFCVLNIRLNTIHTITPNLARQH